MPFQPVPDTALCTVRGIMDSQLTINDLCFQISGGGITPVNLNDLVQAVDGWASTSLAPQLSRDWSYERTDAIDLGSATGASASASTPTVGGVNSEAVPNNVAACVSLRTAQRGRSGRGRNYVPGLPGLSVQLNTLEPTFADNLLLIYNSLIGAGTFIPGWQLVVVSRRTGGLPRPAGISIPVTSVIFTTTKVRSMRSREVGHGA